MSLNKKLMEQYKDETGKNATYNSDGSTFHFLAYVDWLEDRLSKKLPELCDILHAAPYHDAHRAVPYMEGMEEAYNIIMKVSSGKD